MSPSTVDGAVVQPPQGCTLAAYAAYKHLPENFLRAVGVSQVSLMFAPALRISYRNEPGDETAVRLRVELVKGDQVDNRFRWRRGDKPDLYGLWRLHEARVSGYVVLVEGESDAHTLWFHGIPALGVPGASAWREAWAAHFEGIRTIYVLIEPDRGGEAVMRWVSCSVLRDRVRLVHPNGAKDPSELYVYDTAAFTKNWQAAVDAAVPWSKWTAAQDAELKDLAWQECARLAQSRRILDRLADDLAASGLAGEVRPAKLIYLCIMSRLLPRPVSAALKGPTSAGKSQAIARVVKFFPRSAYWELTAMSERALAYSDEPLKNRILVLYEALAIQGEFGAYLMRSLLSEGCVRYETVEKTSQGLRHKMVEREGPTGLLVSTTAIRLDKELETRLFSIPISDTPEQTKQIMLAIARAGEQRPQADLRPWQALQEWIQLSSHDVSIPYAGQLAELVPPVAVRLRRDFGALLALIGAHALLHQASRGLDQRGRVVATLEDYEVVRELVGDLLAHGVQAAVPIAVQETVAAVAGLCGDHDNVTAVAVATLLKIDKSSATRRLRDAAERGYLANSEKQRGKPGKWVLADPLPNDLELLPPPTMLASGCAVGVVSGGIKTPPPLRQAETSEALEEVGAAFANALDGDGVSGAIEGSAS